MNSDATMRQAVDEGRLDGITPVFIVGPPQCGADHVQRILDAHPDAVVAGETNVFNVVGWPLLNLLDQFRRQVSIGLPRRTGERCTLPAFSDGQILQTLRIPVERTLLAHLADAGRLAESRPRVVGDQSIGHARHVRLLAGMFPEARFILCTRDVRDASLAAWTHLGAPSGGGVLAPATSLHEGAEIFARHHWAELIRFSRGPGRQMGPDRFLELDHETHHADPPASIRRLLEFLELERSDRTVASIAETTGDDDARSGIGGWRERFTEEFAAYLIAEAGERLALGEEPVDNRPRIQWTGPTTRPEALPAA